MSPRPRQILKNAAKLKASSFSVGDSGGPDTGGAAAPGAAASQGGRFAPYERGGAAVHPPRSPRKGVSSPERGERKQVNEAARKFHDDYQQYLASLAEQQAQRQREEQAEIERVQALRAALARAVRRRLAETRTKAAAEGSQGQVAAPPQAQSSGWKLPSSPSKRFSSPRRMHRAPPAPLDIVTGGDDDCAEEGVSVTRPPRALSSSRARPRASSVERPSLRSASSGTASADSPPSSSESPAAAATSASQGFASKPATASGPPPSSRSSRVTDRLFEAAREAALLSSARSGEEIEWMRFRKRHGISADTRVFVMSGAYTDVKASLVARGWFHNPEPESLFFNLQWALKASDIRYERLRQQQVVNHFVGSSAITTKQGLVRSLNSLVWHEEADSSCFFPRSYELLNAAAVEDFEARLQSSPHHAAEYLVERA